jgi:CHASE1-domain containing sensor protein
MQFFINSISKLSSLHNKKVLALVVSVSFFVVFGAWYFSNSYSENLIQQRFEIEVEENTELISNQLSGYANALQSGIAYFQASSYVDREEWKQFVDSSEILTRFPGIQGIGYVKMVRHEELDAFEKQMRFEGIPSFSIKPKGAREFYTPVVYLEPANKRNLKAIGYDIFSEPIRREAEIKARDSGKTTITRKIQLIQEDDKDIQAGILMMSPLYKVGSDTTTLQGRREAFLGFVDGAFRMNDLMKTIVSNDVPLDFTIHDTNVSDDAHLLYRSFTPSSYIPKYHVQKNSLSLWTDMVYRLLQQPCS